MMTLQAGAFNDNVRFSPGGELLAAATGGGTVALWDMTTGARSGEPFVAYSEVVSGPNVGGIDIAFSPDGRTLATSGAGQAVDLWEAGTHRRVRPALAVPSPDRVAGSPRCFCAVAFSPDGRLLAAGASDGTIALIDVRTWTIRRRLPAHRPGSPGGAIALAFTPRGSRVVSSAQGSVVIDDVATGRRTLLATPPGAEPGGLAFSRDGTRLAIGGGESQLVDTETWRTILTVGGASRSQLGSVALRFDGKLLATGTYGSASLWDLATGDPVGEPLATWGSPLPTLGLAFSPDGTRLATGDFGGNVLLWDIRPDAWARKACALAGGNLTRSEWNQSLPGISYRATCPRP
jgi:WD40 repeat protein